MGLMTQSRNLHEAALLEHYIFAFQLYFFSALLLKQILPMTVLGHNAKF